MTFLWTLRGLGRTSVVGVNAPSSGRHQCHPRGSDLVTIMAMTTSLRTARPLWIGRSSGAVWTLQLGGTRPEQMP